MSLLEYQTQVEGDESYWTFSTNFEELRDLAHQVSSVAE